jgi:peptidoglycan/xylan/chitin deacetylase (PgdA/CDA1 family)
LLRWGGITDNLDSFRPVLNTAQLHRLSQSPSIEIGAHTISHSRLSVLPIHLQQGEIEQSGKKLESWIGKPVTIFSYPYGAKSDFALETKSLVRQAGFQYGIANIQGCVSSNTDVFEVPRRLVRDWQGSLFADWMRTADKDALEKQTLMHRADQIIQRLASKAPTANSQWIEPFGGGVGFRPVGSMVSE